MLSNKEIKTENIKLEVELFNSEEFCIGNEGTEIVDAETSASTVRNELLSSCLENDDSDPLTSESFQKVWRIFAVTRFLENVLISKILKLLKCMHSFN